jgi:hypothetical protein
MYWRQTLVSLNPAPREQSFTLPTYVDTRAAAAFLGISEGTARNWRTAGIGPSFHRVGSRRVVYDVAVLRAFVEAGYVQTSAA